MLNRNVFRPVSSRLVPPDPASPPCPSQLARHTWSDLVDVWIGFWPHSAEDDANEIPVAQRQTEWPDEWKEYIARSQGDIQIICTFLQQSAEIALKSRICEVSPYLLLLGKGVKTSNSSECIDFSELRTIDATDLVSAVNVFTNRRVSEEFTKIYSCLRSIRNKIMHLGESNVSLDPGAVARQAVSIYLELWPDRNWLSDRLEFVGKTRQAWLYDGVYCSAHTIVLQEWSVDVDIFTDTEFKSLIGYDKSVKRYVCHECVYEGQAKYAYFDKTQVGTAYLNAMANSVSCKMCNSTFSVKEGKCKRCEGEIIGDNSDDWVGFCHVCGEFDEAGSGDFQIT